ncbi:uncharacterized protein At4g37920-like isoform X2 [Castanea sativa]|uniref:uncharacterized protein At4g37920-like isoform X2 n=1 Tax=Castanea sativa TaxID=21020 RepID=UPI003F64EF36
MSVSMSNFLGLELSLAPKPSFFNNTHIINSFPFTEFLSPTPTSRFPHSKHTSNSNSSFKRRSIITHSFKSHTAHYNSTSTTSVQASDIATAQVEEQVEVEVAEGYSLTQFIDKIIEVFLKEKPQSKEWRKYLVFREEWQKYRETFYNRCRLRADAEGDPTMKQKLISLGRKVKKRRKDFTGEFFRYLTLLSETSDSLEDRDAVARLGARCLSAVSAYDNTLDYVDTLEVAQAKFDNILDSPSVDVACEKIKSLAKAKELDSSLILLINSAWASAKESTTMKDEVKDIMHHLYKATKSSLRSIAPKEIKLLKHLLNITDPEERFSALATAFSPGDEHEAKDPNALYTTPKELHKWIKIMLDAYNLSKEDTDIREVKHLTQPVVIQRLFILKETIEEEYLESSRFQDSKTEGTTKSEEL